MRRPAGGLGRAGQLLRQVAAVHKLHGEIGLLLVLADFVNLHDVRMLQLGGGLGFPAIPLSGLGLLVGLLGLLSGSSAMRLLGFTGAGPAASLLTLVFAGLWPLFASASKKEVVEAPQLMTFRCGKQLRPVSSDSSGWVDASQCAVQQEEVCVCVAAVAVERVKVRSKGKPGVTPDRNLVIRIQVIGLGGTRKIDFKSWSDMGQAGGSAVRLTDNFGGRAYPAKVFGPGTEVVGRQPEFYPHLYAEDVLVFESPRAGVEFLDLELPATAFGGTGTLRLRIPKTMISR